MDVLPTLVLVLFWTLVLLVPIVVRYHGVRRSGPASAARHASVLHRRCRVCGYVTRADSRVDGAAFDGGVCAACSEPFGSIDERA